VLFKLWSLVIIIIVVAIMAPVVTTPVFTAPAIIAVAPPAIISVPAAIAEKEAIIAVVVAEAPAVAIPVPASVMASIVVEPPVAIMVLRRRQGRAAHDQRHSNE